MRYNFEMFECKLLCKINCTNAKQGEQCYNVLKLAVNVLAIFFNMKKYRSFKFHLLANC